MKRLPATPARFPSIPFLASFAAAAAVLVTAAIIAATTGFAWAGNSVSLVVDGDASSHRTRCSTVGELLDDAGIERAPGDLVSPPEDAPLEPGICVSVRHAVPVRLVLGGDAIEVPVVGETVADALVTVGLDPTAGLKSTPSLDTTLEPGISVEVADVFRRLAQEEAPVPYPTRTVEDPQAKAGVRRVVKPGVPGRKLRVYEVLVTAGSEGARTLKAERVVEPAQAEVVAVGTKRASTLVAVSRSRPAEAPQGGRKLRVVSTAYTPGHGADFVTATGTRAGYGVCAVDPDVIPLGTRLYIPGYGYAIAADTGGAIDGNIIDVCFDTLDEALAWGRRRVVVTILP